jgi:hypothetical protein
MFSWFIGGSNRSNRLKGILGRWKGYGSSHNISVSIKKTSNTSLSHGNPH